MLALLAVVLSCVASAPALPDRVAILGEPPGRHFGFGADGFTPELADVLAAEDGIRTFLAARQNPRERDLVMGWDKKFRQYGGTIVDGARVVFLNVACDRPGHLDMFRKVWIVVDDGGSCYFNLRFDPRTKTFSHLAVNGDA